MVREDDGRKTRVDQAHTRNPLDAPMPERAWELLPGESHVWHRRFIFYLSLGPSRTLKGAYQLAKERELGPNGEPTILGRIPNGRWRDASAEWRWVERAAEFDAFQVRDWVERQREYLDVLTYESAETALSTRRKVDELLGVLLGEIDEYLEDEERLPLATVTSLLRSLAGLRKDAETSLRLWLGEATTIEDGSAPVALAANIQAMISKVYAAGESDAGS